MGGHDEKTSPTSSDRHRAALYATQNPVGGMPMCARCSAALGGKTHSGCTSKEPPPTHPGGLFLTSV